MINVNLRPVGQGDAEKLFTWRNHPEVRRWMTNAGPILPDEHQQWIVGVLEGKTPAVYRFLTLDGQDTGFTYLTSIVPELGSAHWGGYLAPDVERGAGRGFAMLFSMALVAFDDLKLEVLRLGVRASNPALSTYRRFGFERLNESSSKYQSPFQEMSLSREVFEAGRRRHFEAVNAIGFVINGR